MAGDHVVGALVEDALAGIIAGGDEVEDGVK